MNLSQLSKIASQVNPDFMWACETLVIKDGDDYKMAQNGVYLTIHKDIIMQDMNTRRRRVLIVDTMSRVIDTNMILCSECGIPVLEECCRECGTPVEHN